MTRFFLQQTFLILGLLTLLTIYPLRDGLGWSDYTLMVIVAPLVLWAVLGGIYKDWNRNFPNRIHATVHTVVVVILAITIFYMRHEIGTMFR